MKVIKDSKNMTAKVESVIEQMEQEWPEMTKEFKKIQREQYELFYINNTIMGLVIFQLVRNYKHQKK